MCLITVFLTVLTLALLFLIFRKKSRNFNLPPGPRGLPFLGNVFDISKGNSLHTLLQYADKYGDIYRIKFLNRHIVCLNSSDIIQKALCCAPLREHTNDRGKLFFSDFLYYGSQSLAFHKEANSKVHREMRKGNI